MVTSKGKGWIGGGGGEKGKPCIKFLCISVCVWLNICLCVSVYVCVCVCQCV